MSKPDLFLALQDLHKVYNTPRILSDERYELANIIFSHFDKIGYYCEEKNEDISLWQNKNYSQEKSNFIGLGRANIYFASSPYKKNNKFITKTFYHHFQEKDKENIESKLTATRIKLVAEMTCFMVGLFTGPGALVPLPFFDYLINKTITEIHNKKHENYLEGHAIYQKLHEELLLYY